MTEEQPKNDLKATLRKAVPDALLRERETFLRLGSKAGPIYARLRLMQLLGVRSPKTAKIKPGSRSFLFVCFGNIMRSPMAETFLRKSVADARLNEIRIASAGLHAIPGNLAHPRAAAAAEELGLPLTNHRAQLLTTDLMSQADAVFAMDFQNKAELLARHPESAGKILMLSAYASGPQQFREIGDPYFGDLEATRRCYALLRTCVENLTEDLIADSRHTVAESSPVTP